MRGALKRVCFVNGRANRGKRNRVEMSQGNDNGNSSGERRDAHPPVNLALPAPPQPRQPRSLQDLLRYSTEVTAAAGIPANNASPPGLLDEESKQFLEEALKNMTVDIIGELKKSIKILQNANNITESCEDSAEYEAALDNIFEYVDNVDVANDFYKVGGFNVLNPCLNSSKSSLRWRGAELVANLCQNNNYCQEKILESKILPTLLNMIDNDINEIVKVKAMYAVSCLVRANEEAPKEFANTDGYSVLLRALQSDIIKLKIKAAFLVSALCNQRPEIKGELVQMGYVEQLIGLAAVHMQSETEEHTGVLEHLLNALVSMIQNHEPSRLICAKPELQFREIMNCVLENTMGKDDCREEHENAQALLQMVFKEGDNSLEEDR